MKFIGATIMLFAAAHTIASSVEDEIKANLSKLLAVPIEKVSKSGFGDLYEVILTSTNIAYTDKSASFLIVGGAVLDTATKQNLTEMRIAELSRFDWRNLPLQDAIKTVKGNGAHG
ncbi:hypothetical protein IB286_14810 [Spongiibacter sp. KMU-158]|uniref:Disulphide bond isomerase DsbC/G N-terminal domain-containing protein n=1 Tax=Spongiibacter pelagi TaxID=2760804 RepID=A0A927GXR2_9GAMM|nr:disulfide isomerase DsbC N-terminal domain-containing protein [Spongiibacter pelagi]MBD2860267.1 hypothetical protein [Spongiibacter pelagi]